MGKVVKGLDIFNIVSVCERERERESKTMLLKSLFFLKCT